MCNTVLIITGLTAQIFDQTRSISDVYSAFFDFSSMLKDKVKSLSLLMNTFSQTWICNFINGYLVEENSMNLMDVQVSLVVQKLMFNLFILVWKALFILIILIIRV